METMFWIAFQWILLAFLASIISIRPGTTLMMSTGLTFGTISALYGLSNQYITNDQYSIIVIVVILSAIVPTIVAQKFFFPQRILWRREEKQG